MPTTASDFGLILLVPFPYTDQTASKKRPAVVVSSDAYNRSHSDYIVAAVTSQLSRPEELGDVAITNWRQAGLLKPSCVKSVLTTISRTIVMARLGRLVAADRDALKTKLRKWLG
ncbi:MAG: type II toxin-antitoxin system PemK/MazF family toxin [Planctomycetes bacterium]|nr:type II toxin-antitoxin system PemK/MazF family toxin [Planctomycetota bacterium]